MIRLTSFLLATAVVATTFLPAPAVAQSDNWNALYDRIIRLEHEVRAIQSNGGGGSAGGDQSYRLTAIEDQLRQLLQNVGAMREQMRDMQSRIRRLEQQKSSQAPAKQQRGQQSSVVIADPLPSYESYADENNDLDLTVLPEGSATGESASGGIEYQTQFESVPQDQVLGQLVISNNNDGFSEETQTDNTLLPGQVETTSLDNPTAATGDDLYQQSYKHLLSRRFGEAEAGFKTFISQNPSHPSASKAQYWLGETYYTQGRYKQAAQSFLAGYKQYPKGSQAPESLLKLGMSLGKLGLKKRACGVYAEVRRSYPSAKDVRSLAAKESKRAGC